MFLLLLASIRPLFQVWNDCSSPPRSAIAWKRTVQARSVILLSIAESERGRLRERSRRRRFSKPPISKQVERREISSPSSSQSTNNNHSLVPTRHPKLHHVVAVLGRHGHFLDVLHEIIARLDYTSHIPIIPYKSSLRPGHPRTAECL